MKDGLNLADIKNFPVDIRERLHARLSVTTAEELVGLSMAEKPARLAAAIGVPVLELQHAVALAESMLDPEFLAALRVEAAKPANATGAELGTRKAVPASEAWLHGNPKALASVRRGMEQSAKGQVHDRSEERRVG